MAKVLVLYYSSYGHIETMAGAIAEGAREAGAAVDIKRVPELVSPEVAKASHYKTDQAAPVARGRPGGLRRDHPRRAHALRQHGRADEELPRPDRRPVGAGQAGGQGGLGLHLHRHAARRAGEHHPVDAHRAAAPRHGHRRPALCVAGADAHQRSHRRQPLWGLDHRRRRRQPPAVGQRAGRRARQGAHVARIAARLAG